jgi:hypothetical protein
MEDDISVIAVTRTAFGDPKNRSAPKAFILGADLDQYR